jgi:hypothetical protein
LAKKKKKSRRRGGSKKAMTKAAMDGALAGIAPGLARRFGLGNMLGNYTEAAALGAVGYFRKNNTLITLAAFEAAQQFIGGSNGNGGSGAFE